MFTARGIVGQRSSIEGRLGGGGARVITPHRERRILRGGLVFKAHRLLYHSTPSSRDMMKKNVARAARLAAARELSPRTASAASCREPNRGFSNGSLSTHLV